LNITSSHGHHFGIIHDRKLRSIKVCSHQVWWQSSNWFWSY